MSAWLYLSWAATFLLQYVASMHRVIDPKTSRLTDNKQAQCCALAFLTFCIQQCVFFSHSRLHLCVMKVWLQLLPSMYCVDLLRNYCKKLSFWLWLWHCALWNHLLWIEFTIFRRLRLEFLTSTDQTALEHTESTFNTYSLLLSSRIHIHFLLFGIDQSQRKEETDVMAPACFFSKTAAQ